MVAQDFTDSAMVALVPSEADAQRLAVEGYETPEVLHVTLHYLGDDLSWVNADRETILTDLRNLASAISPIKAKAWAVANFNPSENQCACYLIGNSEDLVKLHDGVDMLDSVVANSPAQHRPWVPHLAIGYNLGLESLNEAGSEVLFDRVRLAIGAEDIDIPLGDAVEDAMAASGENHLEPVSDFDAVLYDIDVDKNDVEALQAMALDPDRRWYATRRLRALGAEVPEPVIEEEPHPHTEIVTASGKMSVPVIRTADDLPFAIRAALEAPQIQWYVERRAKALGLEVTFPW